MKPLKPLRTTDSDNPGWLRRMVRRRELATDAYLALFDMPCPKTDLEYRKALMLAVTYGQVMSESFGVADSVITSPLETEGGEGIKRITSVDTATPPNAGADAPATDDKRTL
jgi:hypothetical protein